MPTIGDPSHLSRHGSGQIRLAQRMLSAADLRLPLGSRLRQFRTCPVPYWSDQHLWRSVVLGDLLSGLFGGVLGGSLSEKVSARKARRLQEQCEVMDGLS